MNYKVLHDAAMNIGASYLFNDIIYKFLKTEDDKIIDQNKKKMLQYYYNDIIQGQAP